jgi:hypothetical protein
MHRWQNNRHFYLESHRHVAMWHSLAGIPQSLHLASTFALHTLVDAKKVIAFGASVVDVFASIDTAWNARTQETTEKT